MDVSNIIRALFIRIFLAFLILFVIIKVMKEKFISWLLHEHNSDSGMSVLTRGYMISDISTKRLNNNSVITNFQPSNNNMCGDPIRITISSIQGVQFCVLRNVSLSSFHALLIGDHKNLTEYIITNAVEKYTVKPGNQDIFIHVNVQPYPDHIKRDKYSLVIGLISNASDSLIEEINITCYIIHVKIREEEQVSTSIMYTYWKTNWNRLLTPQILFDAAGENGENSLVDESNHSLPIKQITSSCTTNKNDKIYHNWRLSCFICLSTENTTTTTTPTNLRVFLPCRHAPICSDCFNTLYKLSMFSINNHLIGLLTCPICRTPVNSTLLLPE
ncbi:unnamed protein product [Schistosoma turkestanicum]|nr:unnamed protein product [Schistosoma turkestanicum]